MKKLYLIFAVQFFCSTFAMKQESNEKLPIFEYMPLDDKRNQDDDQELCALVSALSIDSKEDVSLIDQQQKKFNELCNAARNFAVEKAAQLIEDGAPLQYGDDSALFSVIIGTLPMLFQNYCLLSIICKLWIHIGRSCLAIQNIRKNDKNVLIF